MQQVSNLVLKRSPSLLQPRVYLQPQEPPCLNNITDHWDWLNYTVISLKSTIPCACGLSDCLSGPIGLGPQLCTAAEPVIDLLNPAINVIPVLREVNPLWV